MKRKITLIFGILLFVSIYISLTSAKVKDLYQEDIFTWSAQYKFSFKLNTDQKKPYSEYMLLMFNYNKSGFRSVSNFVKDSIKRTEEYKRLPQMQAVSKLIQYPTRIEEYITTDIKTKEITYTTTATTSPPITHPQYIEKIETKWTISGEKRKINGVQCTKATISLFGRDWSAWFSEDYPFPFGPYKFFGLPGLIFEVEDSTGSYKYELVKINREQIRYPQVLHDNIIKLSKKEAVELYKKTRYSNSLFDKMTVIDGDKEFNRKLAKRNDALKNFENNPIELQLEP